MFITLLKGFTSIVDIHTQLVNYNGHASRYCCVFKIMSYVLIGCMSLHCFTVVHVQKILLPCLDLLMTVPALLCHITINDLDLTTVMDLLFFDMEWKGLLILGDSFLGYLYCHFAEFQKKTLELG